MEYHLRTPLTRSDVDKLRVGDVVYLSGTLFTARDKAHVRMAEYFSSGKPLPFRLEGAAVFHGAPIVRKQNDAWEIVAIGPTTSARMNSLEPAVIRHGTRLIIGKGGMDRQVLDALRDCGCVYLSMTGGAAVLGARMVKAVTGVEWEDLGLAEAVWVLDVADFGPLTVTMDAHGGDRHAEVRARTAENIKAMRSN
ncbi:MAG TPA: FumA C-terminus/TtdB family hydratase beta subunit [Methanocella sp.]|jgi:fumarate hydratase subunit beta